MIFREEKVCKDMDCAFAFSSALGFFAMHLK